MQQTRSVELGTGLFVLLGMGALFFLTTQTTGTDAFSGSETYEVTARSGNALTGEIELSRLTAPHGCTTQGETSP